MTLELYEGMLMSVTSEIKCISELLSNKYKQKEELEKRIQNSCPHTRVVRIREDGDDRSHTECLRCKTWGLTPS